MTNGSSPIKACGNMSHPKRELTTIKDALNRKGSWFGEIPLYKANQTPFYVLLWINLVKNEKDNPVCIMASFIDITDRKQMEAVKRSALEQIEKNIEQFAILGDHITKSPCRDRGAFKPCSR